jgi:hypothetical protein
MRLRRHVTTHTFQLTEAVLPVRPVTVSGAGIPELYDLRVQEDDIVLPFLLRGRIVRRRDRHPAPVVILGDQEVFLFRLRSPLEADRNRVGDLRLVHPLARTGPS